MNSSRNTMVRCPACGKEVPYENNPFRPFCSKGCKSLDLVNWADESYRISKQENDEKDREDGE
ncbi:MAG TPA: DNA gyrase inhibitor YacG [Deltaproteobacteria bacterium]|nr:DNA gyrase inhibitor YacG [Deltaproteobacteria bacterium]